MFFKFNSICSNSNSENFVDTLINSFLVFTNAQNRKIFKIILIAVLDQRVRVQQHFGVEKQTLKASKNIKTFNFLGNDDKKLKLRTLENVAMVTLAPMAPYVKPY